MSNKSFDENDDFRSESEEKETSRVIDTAPNFYAAKRQQDDTKRSASTISKKRSSVKRRPATDKKCLDQQKNAFPEIDPAVIKNKKDIENLTFAETIEKCELELRNRLLRSSKQRVRAFLNNSRKPPKFTI